MKRISMLTVLLVVFGLAGGAVAQERVGADFQRPADDPLYQLNNGVASVKNGPLTVRFHTRLQAWGGWVQDDALLTNGDRIQEPGFRMRRARLGLDGQFMDGVTYELELDLFDQERAGGPLYTAMVDWTPTHFFGVSAGVQKFLFMQSEILSSGRLPHLDRPYGTFAMSPSNTMGTIVHSSPWKDHLTISLGVFNGLRRKTSFHGGYEGVGVSLGNRFEGMAYAGRLDLVPLDPMGRGLADPGQVKSFRVALGGAGFYNDGGSITGLGYSGYLHLKAFGAHLFAEFAQDKAEPKDKPTTTSTVTTTMERRVLNASVGYVFLKDMLGLAARFEMLDDNMDMDSQGDEWLVTGTLTWYVRGDYLKVQAEYTHREEQHGPAVDNDSAIMGVQLMF